MSANEEQTNVVRFNISYINRFNISLGIAMKIAQLVQSLDEAGARSPAQQRSMQAAATGKQRRFRPQTSVTTNPPVPQSTQAVPVPQSSQAVPAPQSTQAVPAPQTPNPDPTLSQPLPADDPNKPGLSTRIGQGLGKLAKGIGAVAGVPAGIGRAIKKGYQAGANTVGGPGASSTNAAAPSSGGGSTELDQLRATLQAMDQRMRRAGFESKK